MHKISIKLVFYVLFMRNCFAAALTPHLLNSYYHYCLQMTMKMLEKENQLLRHRVSQQAEQIHSLRSHIRLIRQHTITFILNQMDTLHMQRDTEV